MPDDILVHEIATFLTREEILQFNEVLPVKARIIKKFSRKFAENHHITTMVDKWTAMIISINGDTSENEYKRLQKIYKVVQDIYKPVNLLIPLRKNNFRLVAIERFNSFENIENNGSLFHRMIKRLCNKVVHVLKNL